MPRVLLVGGGLHPIIPPPGASTAPLIGDYGVSLKKRRDIVIASLIKSLDWPSDCVGVF